MTEEEASTLRRTLVAAQTYLPQGDAEVVQYLAVKLSPYIRQLPIRGAISSNQTEVFLAGHPSLQAQSAISEKLLTQVRQALDTKQRMHISYYGAHRNTISERTIQPYLLLNWRGELYLIAYCEMRRALRHFFLPRIQTWAPIGETNAYKIPGNFDADQYLNAAFELHREETAVTVRARFSPMQARWIRERRYHQSQEIEEIPDGSLVVTFHIAGTAEILRWLLSFGAEVEVLEPESLREQILKESKRIAAQYIRE